MKTIVEKITKEQLNTEEGKKIIGQAGDFLKEGGLVAVSYTHLYLDRSYWSFPSYGICF